MSSDRIRVAVIIGSVRKGRLGPTIANWFTGIAGQREDLQIDLVDLADYDLPNRLTDEPGPELTESLGKVGPRLAEADAFVVVTPEYNHSYPGSLKALIDWHTVEWHAKPVGFISYGGQAGGIRAVEHLRPIFSEAHAMTIRQTVVFHQPWDQFDDKGELRNPTGAENAAKALLDQLAWWAGALVEWKARHPYSG
ncbi:MULTISPECIES: NADPH-dependent FMN reductase [Streptomyces]|uniref:NAD(P)H-dependent oxidoreductase n=1 Tax=Streptomyces silvisoli TaxID=3034235 RepID=A0ABT5ZQW8_9ACTN|nr:MULTISPECIES: NAD(P)H-dependent oxidoreductase [Streptomyces]MDF3292220.1 NAD(P)H-dependent oxidoreductase [Streptomyces silvisoli]